jgi:dGTPase
LVFLRREDLEDRELRTLGALAAQSRNSGGRRLAEPEDPLRTAFQRDRDRVIHSTAFRRMQGKTQVLASFQGDHFRTRLTHSLEVSQMSRSVCAALRLNADLAEAVALCHDVGHPPFGHVGEEALHELMAGQGGFRHNAQGSRTVDYLEDRQGQGHGLNLTLLTRRSQLKGKVPDGFPLAPDLLPRQPPPIEAQVVDLCDRIAYLSHDLDDGLRAGLLEPAAVAQLRLWQLARQQAPERPRVISELVSLMVHDLVEHCEGLLAAVPPGQGPPRIAHGEAMAVMTQEVLEFLRVHFYHSAQVLAVMHDGAARIRRLFAELVAHPDRLPEVQQARVRHDGLERAVCDYIAGMTDRFLLQQT